MKDQIFAGIPIKTDDRLQPNELGFSEADGTIKVFVLDLETESAKHVRSLLPNGTEVRPATDAEQRTALERAFEDLGPPFTIRLVYGKPERPCAMMPIGIQHRTGAWRTAWTDESGCLPQLPRNSKLLQAIKALDFGDQIVPFNIPEEGDSLTINTGPDRPKGFKQ